MTNTAPSDAVKAQQWQSDYHAEYVRSNRFKPYMGVKKNAIINVIENLTKQKGDRITVNLVGALDASAGPNTGGSSLVGNEKALPNDGHKITVGIVRDATVVNVEDEQASAIDIFEAGKEALMDLQLRYLRDSIITAFGSVHGSPYVTADAATKNAWHDANSDRVVYGNAKGNFVASDHAASLATVTGTMKLSRAVVSLYKRIAQTAKSANGDGIRPYKYSNDRETYVMFVDTLAFRDFRQDLEDGKVLSEARERAKSNPLFTGPTCLEWDGVLVCEIPEINTIAGVGAAGIDVAPVYLCGAQALGVAWAKRTKMTRRKEDDYEYERGVGFMEMRGVEKILYGQGTSSAKDWGMLTGFVAGVADA